MSNHAESSTTWENYPEEEPTWDEQTSTTSSRISSQPTRWEEVNFTAMGRWQQCQSKKWNPKYHQQSQSYDAEGHHTHYYCRYCKYNFNPTGWWNKPTEEDQCDCWNVNNSDSDTSSFSDPDEEYYEEPWNPHYRSEEGTWQSEASEACSLEPSVTIVTADGANPWNNQAPVDYAW